MLIWFRFWNQRPKFVDIWRYFPSFFANFKMIFNKHYNIMVSNWRGEELAKITRFFNQVLLLVLRVCRKRKLRRFISSKNALKWSNSFLASTFWNCWEMSHTSMVKPSSAVLAWPSLVQGAGSCRNKSQSITEQWTELTDSKTNYHNLVVFMHYRANKHAIFKQRRYLK